MIATLSRRRRTAPAGAADAPWRTGADAHAAGRSRSAPRRSRCRRARSCRRPLPARKRWRRWSASIASAPNISPICFAASGRLRLRLAAKSRVCGIRQRRRRGRGAAEGGDVDAGTEADQGRGARPVPPSADAAGTARLRCGRVRSAAAGRAGAGQQLAASKIPVVVAVSCNVATFARDARILIDGGYRIEGVTPVDQFRHTPHVELVARFGKSRAGKASRAQHDSHRRCWHAQGSLPTLELALTAPSGPARSSRRSGN